MNAYAKLKHELCRILSERLTMLFITLSSVGVLWFSLNSTGTTRHDTYILEPAKNSALLGALLFSLLTIVQFHRDFKNNTDSIILTCTDPVLYQLRRTLALIGTAVMTTLIITLFALPYGIAKTGEYFQPVSFLTAWYLIYLSALIFAVLLASGLYMLTKRTGATFIIMAGFIMLSKLFESMYTFNPSYLFYWVQTTASNFSDLITNQFQIDMVIWNRLFCLLVSMGIWSLGLCSFRRYGCGLPRSFLVNCRRIWIPATLLVALLFSGASYTLEPIFDDSKPMDLSGAISSDSGIVTSYGAGQEAENCDLTLIHKTFALDIDANGRSLSGIAKYTLTNAEGKAQSLQVMTNTGLTISSVQINGEHAEAIRGETGANSIANWSIKLPAADEYIIEMNYCGGMLNDNTVLQQAAYGIANGYIWLPKYGVSPSLDVDVSENSTFSGTILLDNGLEPVCSRGESVKGAITNRKIIWQYTGIAGTQDISLYAANYMTKSFEAGGLNIELKYFAKHDKSIADMNAVNVIKSAIDYFTQVYGPLIYDKSLTTLELPAYVSGGFASGNMSAMGETSFNAEGYISSESLTPDSGGGIDVLIHEIAHQWWGLATIPVQDENSSWSAEGITCYSTYCFMKEYFGEEYAQQHFVEEWQQG